MSQNFKEKFFREPKSWVQTKIIMYCKQNEWKADQKKNKLFVEKCY